MSLDVTLIDDTKPEGTERPAIFIRENGRTVEISREEWDDLCPGTEPVTDTICDGGKEVYTDNITHNLITMARECDLYLPLWRPDEIGISTASELIIPLIDGLKKLATSPDHYKQFNPENGWGNYDVLVRFVLRYIGACVEYQQAKVEVSR
jgi:hypothetical protein